MRILFFAKDAPYINSGYGKCCREISQRLNKLGHEVAIFATVGNRSSPFFEWQGLKIYPGVENIFGEDVVLDHYNDWKADIFLTQIDIWPIRIIPELAAQGAINWVPYVPLDSDPIPAHMIEKLKCATYTICMCEWAKKQLDPFGIDSTWIHHGIDTQIYKILPNKTDLKKALGFPADCYLIGMVQANQFLRKALEEQFRGVALFRQLHPQIDVRLYCHTTPLREDSYNLDELAGFIGIKDIIKFPSPYKYAYGFSEEDMAKMYNAFDVLLSATNGEGFGLPVIESQACGVPVITTDIMSFPELTKFGKTIPVKTWFTMPALMRKAVPDETAIALALWEIYNAKWNRQEISDTAHYLWNWDSKIIQEWMWTLQRIQDKIDKKCLKLPASSELSKKLANEEVVV